MPTELIVYKLIKALMLHDLHTNSILCRLSFRNSDLQFICISSFSLSANELVIVPYAKLFVFLLNSLLMSLGILL